MGVSCRDSARRWAVTTTSSRVPAEELAVGPPWAWAAVQAIRAASIAVLA